MKKRRISPSVCLVLMIIAAFVSFQITYSFLTNRYESTIYGFNKWSQVNSSLDDIEKIVGEDSDGKWQRIYTTLAEVDRYTRAGYVGTLNEEDLLTHTLDGYVYGTGDKYAAYMPPSEYEAFTKSSVEGSIVGIGVRIAYDNTFGGIYITAVVPDSPAEAAGLAAGDVIVAVEGNNVSEFGYYQAYNLIKSGAEGENCNLTVVTKSSDYTDHVDVTLSRAIVKTKTVTTRMLDADTAYVQIIEFDIPTTEEFTTAMDALIADGAKRFVFDVRNNPGGNVTAVCGVLDYLLPEGPIIRTYTGSGEENTVNSDAKCLDAPMAVLINGNTASGGELFTAALRDYNKATVIGTTSFGKGTMQTVVPLSNGGALKISTEMYNPPYGENYEGVGITPDKTVELSEEALANFYRLTDEEDVQLMAALDEVRNMPLQ